MDWFGDGEEFARINSHLAQHELDLKTLRSDLATRIQGLEMRMHEVEGHIGTALPQQKHPHPVRAVTADARPEPGAGAEPGPETGWEADWYTGAATISGHPGRGGGSRRRKYRRKKSRRKKSKRRKTKRKSR